MSKFDEYLSAPANRDRLTMYYLPEHCDELGKLSHEQMNMIAANILGTNEFTCKEVGTSLDNTLFYYGRIFELCRVLGVSGIYDIGCQNVNQAFLLVNYSTIAYTGISPNSFDLASTLDSAPHTVLQTNEAPPPLCDGRISFVKGYYPRDTFDIKPNNIAVACYSFTMLRDEDKIKSTVTALKKDFDRVLFNIACFDNDSDAALRAIWKSADWTGFDVYPHRTTGILIRDEASRRHRTAESGISIHRRTVHNRDRRLYNESVYMRRTIGRVQILY